jgi:hypothetical protein
MAWPIMKAAPSEHSQMTASAISSGLAHPPDRLFRDDLCAPFGCVTVH